MGGSPVPDARIGGRPLPDGPRPNSRVTKGHFDQMRPKTFVAGHVAMALTFATDLVSVCSKSELSVAGVITTWGRIEGDARKDDKPSHNSSSTALRPHYG